MSKIELDDMILEHPKFIRAVKLAGSDTVFLWLGLRAYCARMLTDGFVPEDMIEEVRGPREASCRARALSALREAKLVDDAEGGIRLHDYLDWAQSRDQVLAWRKANAERKARSRARVTVGVTAESRRDIGNVTVGVTRESHCSHGGSHGGVPEPSPSPSPSASPKDLYRQGKDLPGSAHAHGKSSPRHDDNSELQSEPETRNPSGTELAATESSVRANRVQPEPAEPKLVSERQPVALQTRAERVRTELSELPIGELAKRWRENPTWVAESSPQSRPELLEVEVAWDRAVGLRPTPLGHATRDPCTRALLQLYADGVPQAALLRACEQAGRTDWICGRSPDFRGQVKKRRVSTLTMGVLRELLDAAPTVQTVSPAVAAILAEKRKEAV